MLVMTAINGFRRRKLPSLSSASATSHWPPPSFALAPAASSWPPMTNVGSNPPSLSTAAARLVVVVLPCVPATAMPRRKRINSASIAARGIIGMRWLRASISSGLSSRMALETTTQSVPNTLAAEWPRITRAPSLAKRRVATLSELSEPETSQPSVNITSAMPLMPVPPMPTKCTRGNARTRSPLSCRRRIKLHPLRRCRE